MICEKCGEKMLLIEGVVCTSNPPMFQFVCPKCGNIQYVIVVGKESNSEKKQIVKFRNLNTNKYQILEWHIFRHYYEHAKLTIKNLA